MIHARCFVVYPNSLCGTTYCLSKDKIQTSTFVQINTFFYFAMVAYYIQREYSFEFLTVKAGGCESLGSLRANK